MKPYLYWLIPENPSASNLEQTLDMLLPVDDTFVWMDRITGIAPCKLLRDWRNQVIEARSADTSKRIADQPF